MRRPCLNNLNKTPRNKARFSLPSSDLCTVSWPQGKSADADYTPLFTLTPSRIGQPGRCDGCREQIRRSLRGVLLRFPSVFVAAEREKGQKKNFKILNNHAGYIKANGKDLENHFGALEAFRKKLYGQAKTLLTPKTHLQYTRGNNQHGDIFARQGEEGSFGGGREGRAGV